MKIVQPNHMDDLVVEKTKLYRTRIMLENGAGGMVMSETGTGRSHVEVEVQRPVGVRHTQSSPASLPR